MSYQVVWFTGDYSARQKAANKAGVICYYEQHFNSAAPHAHYALVLVASNAGSTSRSWARNLAVSFGDRLVLPDLPLGDGDGVKVLDSDDRGYGNLASTAMPACLGEPGFINDPDFFAWLKGGGYKEIAGDVANSIRKAFPKGGKVGFSIGHKGKTSAPNDRGAVAPDGSYEADWAEKVLKHAELLLEAAPESPPVEAWWLTATLRSPDQKAAMVAVCKQRPRVKMFALRDKPGYALCGFHVSDATRKRVVDALSARGVAFVEHGRYKPADSSIRRLVEPTNTAL
jgi:hypothetical protein